RSGSAAEEHGADGAAAGDAAGHLDQPAQRGPEGDLVDAGPRHVAGKAEELGPGRRPRADRGEGLAAVEHDRQHVDERLDVVDDGRLAEEPLLDRERRLVAGLAAEALDRVEERRLLAADVRARAAADLDVEGDSAAEDIAPQESRGPRGG